MRWVEWIEPFGPDNEPVYCRVPETTAVATQKKSAAMSSSKFIYPNDETALDDFMVVHWARFVDQSKDHLDLEK